MSKRMQFLILSVIALVFGGAFLSIMDQTVVPMQAGGPKVNANGWIQVLISAVGSAGFSWASVALLLKHWVEILPISGFWKGKAANAIDIGQIVLYQQLYQKAKDPDERRNLREAVKIEVANLVDEWFPEEPVEEEAETVPAKSAK